MVKINKTVYYCISSELISKNEKRLCEVSRDYFTRFEGQERLNCTVTQSKTPDDDPNFVKTIWQGDLELPPGRPAGQQINVKFSYDENSIIHCEFEDDETKQITEVDIDAKSTSEEESEIDKFLVD